MQKEYIELNIKIPITKTIFNSSALYFEHIEIEKWEIKAEFSSNEKYEQSGVNIIICFHDDLLKELGIRDDPRFIGSATASSLSQRKKEERKFLLGYAKNGRLKLSIRNAAYFKQLISDTFWATRHAVRMSGERKTDIGEYMEAKLCCEKYSNRPVGVLITGLQTYKGDTMKIGGEDVPTEYCRRTEEMFAAQHIPLQPETPGKDIEWRPPTDWIDPERDKEKRSAAYKVKSAVYMWIGSDPKRPLEKYLYIGMVGTERNEENSVGSRIFEQEFRTGIGAQNGLTPERFRYSELRNSGEKSAENVLKTVEMQCINSFSALFEFGGKGNDKDSVIHPLFGGVWDKSGRYSLKLLNKDKRYKNKHI